MRDKRGAMRAAYDARLFGKTPCDKRRPTCAVSQISLPVAKPRIRGGSCTRLARLPGPLAPRVWIIQCPCCKTVISTAQAIVSAAKFGATCGTFLGGAAMLRYGRRQAIALSGAFFTAGPVCMALATAPW